MKFNQRLSKIVKSNKRNKKAFEMDTKSQPTSEWAPTKLMGPFGIEGGKPILYLDISTSKARNVEAPEAWKKKNYTEWILEV